MFRNSAISQHLRPFVILTTNRIITVQIYDTKFIFLKFCVRGFSSSTIHQRCQLLEMKNREIDWATVSREKIQSRFYLGDFVTRTGDREIPSESGRVGIYGTLSFFSDKYRFMASPSCSFSALEQCASTCGLSSHYPASLS